MLLKHVNEAPTPFDLLADGRNVPPEMSAVVLKALEKDPKEQAPKEQEECQI